MTITTPIIADFPAYSIHAAPAGKVWQAGEVFGVSYTRRDGSTGYRFYRLGSVASYSMKNNACPIKALDRAREHGHKLHWANAETVVLTAHKRAKEQRYGLDLGDVIEFEGRKFRLDRAPNDNVNLVEV